MERVYFGGDCFFDAFLSSIDRAVHHIFIEVYIFRLDELGKEVVNRLIQAAHRGVKVKLLIDGFGSYRFGWHLYRTFKKHGIEAKIYHPVPWNIFHWHYANCADNNDSKQPFISWRLNRRNHRKIFLIDNKKAFVGSFNIDSVHLGLERGGKNWRDTGLEINCKKRVKALASIVQSTWHSASEANRNLLSKLRKKAHQRAIQIKTHHQHRKYTYKALLTKINNSQHRIWITTAYFIPQKALIKKLIACAQRGIDVRIILPMYSDHCLVHWVSRLFYRKLIENGVRIYEYKPSMMHSKTIIIDQWVLVGSSNINYRSLLHDLEIDLEVMSSENIDLISQQFIKDLESSERIAKRKLFYPIYQRVAGTLLKTIKYLL